MELALSTDRNESLWGQSGIRFTADNVYFKRIWLKVYYSL